MMRTVTLLHYLYRPDRTMQDIVYKLVPSLYKGKTHTIIIIIITGND